ncbi:MAG TPA: TRAP transporter large permease [Rhodospirillales bacterium]|jgi:tripartite ATP-independent transporter DctM subunit|nr:TRAP transporter large permease [Rhodospirillales bacterium]MDP7426254.1 TRAP transporter large permease [Rhodospirillales bacterium]MDP7624340.1 TRAP transporter large permease [Rhodospirillales bacterium]HJO86928.1 TRAP transporter large permease [Rhodospirillales bacterium]|tara:strand:- start:231 stop:1544 length:1314 start_codon:yes stop_codon:yes gene_type:complete
MDPILIALLGLIGMFALIALHIPIGVAMAISGAVGFGYLTGWRPAVSLFATEPVSIFASMDLAVIPLFLLMGSFAGISGLSSDIYRLAYAFVGHRRGGLALATIGGCAGFGAVCGSSLATAATLGRVALPEMLDRGYSPTLATGCVAAGGTLGMLIPPSVIMVIYAFLAEQFVITMFVAALIPGLIAVLAHFITIGILVRRNPESGPAGPRMSWSERLDILKGSWGVLLLLFTVIGGIYGGVFTVNEAAALGAGLAFMFTVARRKLTLASFRQILSDTASNTAMIYLIISGASIFSSFITLTKMPDALVTAISAADLSPLVVIFVLFAVYLVLGSIFDTIGAMVITMPFVLPLILDLGYHPIWWGIILVMVIEVGMITPPIGMNVFVLFGVADGIPLKTIFKGIFPFFYADLIRITIIILFPALALWLPGILGYNLN